VAPAVSSVVPKAATTRGKPHEAPRHDHWRPHRQRSDRRARGPAGYADRAPELPAPDAARTDRRAGRAAEPTSRPGGGTDEQAGRRTTVSELCLGGLVKHVAATESEWVDFIEGGPAAMAAAFDSEVEWAGQFQLQPGETVAEVLDRYAAVARRTDALVSSLPDLDVSHPLPPAPWFEPGARRSARRVFLHIIAETAQHAGHADIIRESLDGAKTMG